MIECLNCGIEWKVKYLVAKGLDRCPNCRAELDVSAHLLGSIGGARAVRELRQRMKARR